EHRQLGVIAFDLCRSRLWNASVFCWWRHSTVLRFRLSRRDGDHHALQMDAVYAMRSAENTPESQLKREFFHPDHGSCLGPIAVMDGEAFAVNAHAWHHVHMKIIEFDGALEAVFKELHNPGPRP